MVAVDGVVFRVGGQLKVSIAGLIWAWRLIQKTVIRDKTLNEFGWRIVKVVREWNDTIEGVTENLSPNLTAN